MDELQKRTWAEISLPALEHNYRALRALLKPDCLFLGVVKANAYGHGAVPVARKLTELGADYLAVACLDEAEELRVAGIGLPVLILGHTPPEYAARLLAGDFTQTVFDENTARALSDAALACGRRLTVHLKADTGMTRLGLMCDETHLSGSAREMAAIAALPGLNPEGIFTHFAASDDDEGFTRLQLKRFEAVLSLLKAEYGVSFPIRHCANSAAVLFYPETHFDMVRPGIALYGCTPAPGRTLPVSLRPVMTLKTRVAAIKAPSSGATVSYGRLRALPAGSRGAVLPAGYADGLPRICSDRLPVLAGARRSQVLGRICMDLCMIDATALPGLAPGDEITLFGENLPPEEAAGLAGTITYELLCAVSSRVPRVYL
jgi:alanine racemase